MKKIIIALLASFSISACVVVRMPENVNIDVDITVPADYDAEKIEVLIDTLRAQNVERIMTFEIHKRKERKKKKDGIPKP